MHNGREKAMSASVQVPYGLSFGMTNDTVIDLLVCWHTPAAANATHTNGNAFTCTLMGRQTYALVCATQNTRARRRRRDT